MKNGQKGSVTIILLVVIIVILVGAVGYFAFVKKSEPVAQQPTPTPVSNTQTPIPTPTFTPRSQVYGNQYMKVTIPAGWTAKQANKTIYYGNCVNKENCTTTPKVEPNPAAVNITKGNYILYINTQASQASGVIGGRFGEIAGGAPSADAVVIKQPNECGTSETNSALLGHPRIDLYVSPQDKQTWCNVPTSKTVWFFSYIADKAAGGYFNYYVEGQGPTGYVITMAYNSKDVNNFPVKNSPTLNSMLNEMTAIVKSLEIKELP